MAKYANIGKYVDYSTWGRASPSNNEFAHSTPIAFQWTRDPWKPSASKHGARFFGDTHPLMNLSNHDEGASLLETDTKLLISARKI